MKICSPRGEIKTTINSGTLRLIFLPKLWLVKNWTCFVDASSLASFKNGLGSCNTYNNRQALRVLAIVERCYTLQFVLDDSVLRYYLALTDACALDYCRHYNRPNLLMFLNLTGLETAARTVEHYTPDTTQRTVLPLYL